MQKPFFIREIQPSRFSHFFLALWRNSTSNKGIKFHSLILVSNRGPTHIIDGAVLIIFLRFLTYSAICETFLIFRYLHGKGLFWAHKWMKIWWDIETRVVSYNLEERANSSLSFGPQIRALFMSFWCHLKCLKKYRKTSSWQRHTHHPIDLASLASLSCINARVHFLLFSSKLKVWIHLLISYGNTEEYHIGQHGKIS